MDAWGAAHSQLVLALVEAREAGVLEEEALGAVDDVYHEADEHYKPGPPKKPKNLTS